MTDTLLNLAEDNISRRNVNIHKFNHPWLTERSEETVRRKHTAQGLAVEAEAARECSAFFWKSSMPMCKLCGWKQWWAKFRRIADRKQKVSSIPALTDGAKCILEFESNANCFATTFAAKNVMIHEEATE